MLPATLHVFSRKRPKRQLDNPHRYLWVLPARCEFVMLSYLPKQETAKMGVTVSNNDSSTTRLVASELETQVSDLVFPEHVDNWDEYFLYMATAASIKSKDPRCRVGAVIASPSNVILSTGFNGLARGVHDDKHILEDPDEKLKVICHAEQNAILNAARIGVAIEGANIF